MATGLTGLDVPVKPGQTTITAWEVAPFSPFGGRTELDRPCCTDRRGLEVVDSPRFLASRSENKHPHSSRRVPAPARLRLNRQRNRVCLKGQCSLSMLQRGWSSSLLACSRPHKNCKVSQPAQSRNTKTACEYSRKASRKPGLCRSEWGRSRLNRSGSQHRLPVGRRALIKALGPRKEGRRVHPKKLSRVASRNTRGRYEGDQKESQRILFSRQEQIDRDQARCFQRTARCRQKTAEPRRQVLQPLGFGVGQFSAVECKVCLRDNKERCLALSSGRRSLHQNPPYKARKTSLVSCQGCRVHQKRQSRKRQRVRTSISSRTTRGKLHDCPRIDEHQDERQRVFHSVYVGASKSFWRRQSEVYRHRQRLLVCYQQKSPQRLRSHKCRDAETSQFKAGEERSCTRGSPPEPKSWHRTTDRTYKTRRTAREKSNEVRYCNYEFRAGEEEAAGYSSVLGFNLRQMIRHQQGKMKKIA